tara:strand:+ start:19550 stop:21442 length:1893 start_codon:yes stop_codon:yes gene_type:complete
MQLEKNQVQELIQNRPKRNLLENAERHQNRLKLHGETEIENIRSNPAFIDLLAWVESYLTRDKFNRFCQLLRLPVVSLEITKDIYQEYQRIFDGQNPFFNYEFSNPDNATDFKSYLNKELKDREFFKTIGFDQLRYSINSILVVDMPTDGTGNPYYYFVDVSNVIDVKSDKNGTIKYVVFQVNKNTIAVYDSTSYRVYNVDANKIIGEPIVDNTHNLGYCPASYFWNQNLKGSNTVEKKSPITEVLGRLDKYLVEDTFKEYADLYGTFPIITTYEELCNFDGCDNGFISSDYTIFENGQETIKTKQTKCPSCSNREEIGPGTIFEIPAPQTNDDPVLSNPVSIITPDTKSLEYIKQKLIEYADGIREVTIGTRGRVLDNNQVNETQVFGSFESRQNILLQIASSFEAVHKFANDTVARLMFGDSFISSVVFYGDQFFLKSVNDLMEEYKLAKQSGQPDEEIDQIYRQILVTKYKGNDDRIERAWILYNLNPEPHKTVDQSRLLVSDGVLDKPDFVIKARFSNFVARFEREQTNVLDFGRELKFDDKINRINEILLSYAVIDETKAVDNPLRSLVGSLTGVIELSKLVYNNDIDRNSAVAIMVKTLGYSLDDAKEVLTTTINKQTNENGEN